MKKIDPPIIVKQNFHSPLEIVWKSITELEKMHQWYFEKIPSFKPEVGFKTQFNIKSGERNFLHKWEVLEVIPHKLIKYNWKYENYPGDSNVTFELLAENNKTKLKLTVEVLEDFPQNIPEFKRESCIGGWEYFIKDRLKKYLES